MAPEPYNFIVAKLCDNDFGHLIAEAFVEGMDHWGLKDKACPVIWKGFIIAYIIGHTLKRDALLGDETTEEDIRRLKRYLQSIRVTFEKYKPTDNDDSGSAAYDINQKYAWTF